MFERLFQKAFTITRHNTAPSPPKANAIWRILRSKGTRPASSDNCPACCSASPTN